MFVAVNFFYFYLLVRKKSERLQMDGQFPTKKALYSATKHKNFIS